MCNTPNPLKMGHPECQIEKKKKKPLLMQGVRLHLTVRVPPALLITVLAVSGQTNKQE